MSLGERNGIQWLKECGLFSLLFIVRRVSVYVMQLRVIGLRVNHESASIWKEAFFD
jgi:hypothetical protein